MFLTGLIIVIFGFVGLIRRRALREQCSPIEFAGNVLLSAVVGRNEENLTFIKDKWLYVWFLIILLGATLIVIS